MSAFKIESTRDLTDAAIYAERSPEFDGDKQIEVQTDKTTGKLVPCRGCRAPLVVNAFYAPARASCAECALPRQHAALLGDRPNRKGGVRVVPESVIEATRQRYPECRCEQAGAGTSVKPRPALVAGMPVADLSELAEGCTGSGEAPSGGWVCQRLDLVRRQVNA